MALSIATYNLLDFFEPPAGDEAGHALFARKVDYLAQKITAVDADVIGLQEVGSDEAVRVLGERLAPHRYARVVGTPDQRGIRCAVLSRLPVLAAEVHTAEALPFPVFVEGDPPPFGKRLPLRRGIVHVEVESPVGRLHVLVVHFKSGRPAPLKNATGEPIEPTTSYAAMEALLRSVVLRSSEALFVRALVDRIFAADADANVAVIGDFNDVYSSVTFRALRGIKPTELSDATRSVPWEKRHSLVHYGVQRAIDHVMVSASLLGRVESAHVYNEDLRDHDLLREAGETAFHDSDHSPVAVRFKTD